MIVKIGVIGAGIFGKGVLQAFKQSEKEGIAKLVAFAELNEELLKQRENEFSITGYVDYKEMLKQKELDGVAVVTPDHLHREIALFAAKKGVNLFVEKPLDVSIDGCNEIIEAISKNDLLLQIDFHKRFDPPHRMLKNDIQMGKLGEILYGYMWMEDTIDVPTQWLPTWAAESSPAWFLGIHCYDLFRFLLECNVKEVFATGQKQKLFSMGINTYDSIQAKLKFENGAIINFDSSWVLPQKFAAVTNQGLRIVGTEGIYEIDGQNRGVEKCISEEVGIKTPNPYFDLQDVDMDNNTKFKGYKFDSIQNFVKNLYFIKNGGNINDLREKYPSGEDGKEATRIAEAVHRSINEKRVVII